jgi:hypothetical protein
MTRKTLSAEAAMPMPVAKHAAARNRDTLVWGETDFVLFEIGTLG